MSTDRETTRLVRSWLDQGVTALPDRVLDAVLDQVPATPQRRSWWPARRFSFDTAVTRLGLLAAAVVIAVIAGSNLLREAGPGEGPTPSPTLVPSSASPETSTYTLVAFPVGVALEVPAGWSDCSKSDVEQAVCYQRSEVSPPTEVAFSIVVNVVRDPCGAENDFRVPAAGPSVDDLVAAISGLSRFKATAPIDITVDGFRGKEFTLTAPGDSCASLLTWATAQRTNGVGANEINLLRIVDVDGTRVLVAGAYHPEAGAPAEDLAAVRQVMDSVRFTP